MFTLLPSSKHAPASLGKVLILGLGKSGKAALEYCVPLLGTRVESITVYTGGDDNSRIYSEAFQNECVTFCFDEDTFLGRFDLGIASPGISEFSSLYLNARNACTEIIGEVEFAWRESPVDSQWVAVTGTNGKTTTTALIAHLLQTDKQRACAVGNIGDACIKVVMQGETDVFVAEVSSYQLASTTLFAPEVAILLNITPDHLAWHKSFEAYTAAKKKLFTNLGQDSVAILDATDDVTRSIIRELKAMPIEKRKFFYIPLGTGKGIENSMIKACGSENAAYVQGNSLIVDYCGAHKEVDVINSLQIKGTHNLANALTATCAACVLGVGEQTIKQGLSTFLPLEHRIEPCGSVEGVSFFNDSKATNVDAVIKALSAFDLSRLIILIGGHDKGTDLTELVDAISACKAVVCFGAAGPRFFDALKNESRFLMGSLDDAVTKARKLAAQGDSILLSPACASFDEFDSFEHRGETFKSLVAAYNKKG